MVTTLLTVAVAAAIGSVTVAYNSGTAISDDAEFGSADHLLRLDGGDPRALEKSLAALEQQYGTIDVIGHRSFAVPGGVETLEFRSQDANGPYGSARLALRQGNYPEGSQVAVTDAVASLLGLEIGKALGLDGQRRRVVRHRREPRRPERRVRPRLSLVGRAAGPCHRLGRWRPFAPRQVPETGRREPDDSQERQPGG